MIFATVGTSVIPFDRLFRALDELPGDEPLVVQQGPSSVCPAGATSLDFLAFDDLVDLVRQARVVVTHAGVGTILVALANGRRPVVVPRLRRFAEAVDDHQLDFARRLAAAGLVTLVEDTARLAEAIAGDGAAVATLRQEPGPLASELRDYIAAQIAA
jgi:UDP-N-acetylglucosamine transferase subunit ALG13